MTTTNTPIPNFAEVKDNCEQLKSSFNSSLEELLNSIRSDCSKTSKVHKVMRNESIELLIRLADYYSIDLKNSDFEEYKSNAIKLSKKCDFEDISSSIFELNFNDEDEDEDSDHEDIYDFEHENERFNLEVIFAMYLLRLNQEQCHDYIAKFNAFTGKIEEQHKFLVKSLLSLEPHLKEGDFKSTVINLAQDVDKSIGEDASLAHEADTRLSDTILCYYNLANLISLTDYAIKLFERLSDFFAEAKDELI